MHLIFSEEKTKLLQLVLDTIPCRVFWKDLNLVYRGVNKLFVQDSGLKSAEDLIGKTDVELVWGEDQGAGYQADDRRVINSGEPIIDYEEQQTQSDGSTLWLRTSKIPLRNEANEIIGILGTYVDITAHKIAEQKLAEFNVELEHLVEERTAELVQARQLAEQALEAKSQFLANISHEIRTPMSGILGMVELLKQSSMQEEDKRYLDIIENSGQTLLTVINDILDYSKLDVGKMKIENRSVNLGDFLQQTITPYQASVPNSLQVELDVDPALSGKHFLFDSVRIHQVLSNLLNNACKFTEEGFIRLCVKAEKQDERQYRFKFSVSDTGIGIPVEKQFEMFQPFTQCDQSTARQYGGTGLGLSICSQILSLVDSKLVLRSVVGEGAEFSFSVTLEKVAERENECQVKALSPDTVSLRVLLVEDNPINQLVCSKLCEQMGTDVDIANNGSEAVTLIIESPDKYDLVLMDCQMPVMDGYEATQRIRHFEKENGCVTPLQIVALTAHTLPEHVEQCIDAGMDRHLSKPVIVAELKGLIRQLESEKNSAALAT